MPQSQMQQPGFVFDSRPFAVCTEHVFLTGFQEPLLSKKGTWQHGL